MSVRPVAFEIKVVFPEPVSPITAMIILSDIVMADSAVQYNVEMP
jgi:hypothetical protein